MAQASCTELTLIDEISMRKRNSFENKYELNFSTGFGSRIVGAALLRSKRKSKKPISRMKRSYTVDFAAAQADDSPQQSLSQKRHTRDFTDFGDSPQGL